MSLAFTSGSRAGRGRTWKSFLSLHRATLTAVVALLALSACSGTAEEAEVADVTWTLTELEGAAPLAETTIDLTLTADGMVAGSAGCNQYTGSATFADGDMTLGPNLASTMMACAEPIMAQEATYLAALERVSGYEVADGELRLTDADGNVLARFE